MNKGPSHFKISPKKSLGQNFLTNTAIIDKILSAVAPSEADSLVEIGPGLGALTCPLLQQVKQLAAIEVDERVIPELTTKCASIGNLTLYHQDVLTFDFSRLTEKKQSLRVVGNLPYSISTPLLFHLMDQIAWIQDMHFMLQKEVADRITAKPNTKSYGRLSVMIQYYCQTRKLFNVSAGSFYPKPKVESAVITLIPFEKLPYPAKNFQTFEKLVRETFNHRRKMLSNTLKIIAPNIPIPWETLGLRPQARPETLSVENFVELSNLIHSSKLN